MSAAKITLTETDATRLLDMIQTLRASGSRDAAAALVPLETEVARARRVAPEAIPPDVVTMNSTVEFRDLDSGAQLCYTLTWPSDANPAEGKVSVLAPVGTALLGVRVGDQIEWAVPAGVRRFRVERVAYQPEAAGHRERAPADHVAAMRPARVKIPND